MPRKTFNFLAQGMLGCILLGSISSCQEKKKEVERVKGEFELVSDKIETSFPGSIHASEKYLVWTEPRSKKDQVHVIDLKTGEEVGTCVDMGDGPGEFLYVDCQISNDQLIVSDLNRRSMARFDMNSMTEKSKGLINMDDFDFKGAFECLEIEDGEFIFFNPNNDLVFDYGNYSFGNHFFKEENIKNRFDVSQGYIDFNRTRDQLVYATSQPYIAVYEKKGGEFTLAAENRDHLNYRIIQDKIVGERSPRAIFEIALTEDYIVALQRDSDTKPTKMTSPTDMFPTSLMCYNYDAELVKVVEFNLPILRIAGNKEDNTVYAVVVNPDFSLMKYEL